MGAIVFAGCLGGNSNPDDKFESDPAYGGADSFYTEAFKRYCEGRRTCSPSSSSFQTVSQRVFQYPSLNACKDDAGNWFENEAARDYRLQAVREGRMTFDREAASKCLRGLNLNKCPFDLRYFSCSEAFGPAVEEGEVCASSRDCKNETYCLIASESDQCLGVCTAVDDGEPDPDPDPDRNCTDESCPDDQFCDDEWGGSGDCLARKRPDATCDPLLDEKKDPSCVDGYFCSYRTERCERVVPIGEECSSHDECGVSAFCEESNDGFRDYCTPHKSEGDDCFREGDDACRPGVPCINDTCGWNDDFSYCEADEECRPGSRCLRDDGGFTGQCVPEDHGDDGDQCDSDDWCKQGLFCGDGTCRDGAQSAGEPCQHDSDCKLVDDLYCERAPNAELGRCLTAKRLSVGDPCIDSNACPEGSVCDETCVELVEFAEGESCRDEPGYCEPGTICRPAAAGQWTCRPHAAEGGGCNASFECELGLFCDRDTVVCTEPEPPEESDDPGAQCPAQF
jgi:hypothetical protein